MKSYRNILSIFFGIIFMINHGTSQTSDMDSASLALKKSTQEMLNTLAVQLKLSPLQKEKIAQLYHHHFYTEEKLFKNSENDFEDDVMLLLSTYQKEKFSQLLNYNHRTEILKNYKQ